MDGHMTNLGFQASYQQNEMTQNATNYFDLQPQTTAYLPTNEVVNPGLSTVHTTQANMVQVPTGIDNRLRAIFGKVAPQLVYFPRTNKKICLVYLKAASAAEDANDRAAYLNVISQMWDRIQNHRLKSRKRKRTRKTKTVTPVPAVQQSTSNAFQFTEEDLSWISNYAEFGRLITQLAKTESDLATYPDTCHFFLMGASIHDQHKCKSGYDFTLQYLREEVQKRIPKK